MVNHFANPFYRPIPETRYKYGQSIGSTHLRLLQPVSVSQKAIEFKLLLVPREDAPSYTAVSYTWGDDSLSEVVILDGQPFRVRRNLWSCLFYLVLASRHASWECLWVDAICINQFDRIERNAQVGHMDQIYRDAACVSVWLGLMPVPNERTPLLPRFAPLQTIEGDRSNWEDSMKDLANRPYWSRSWVIQEFLLGKDVQIHCSNSSMVWTAFRDLLCQSADVPQPIPDKLEVLPDHKIAAFAALPLALGRGSGKHLPVLKPLAELLISHRRSKCEDPRDRVFSLLGLVSLDERRLLGRFFPDYTLGEDVVRVITLAHLMACGWLVDPAQGNMSPDIEGIFLGLGVGKKNQTQVLLNQARAFDYSRDWRPGDLSKIQDIGDIIDWRQDPNEYAVARNSMGEAWTDLNGPEGTSLKRSRDMSLYVAAGMVMWLPLSVLFLSVYTTSM